MTRENRWAAGAGAAAAAVLAGAVSGESIYRQVDGDGRITFTDTPRPGAERLVQGIGNTYPARPQQQPIAAAPVTVQDRSDTFAGYETVTVDTASSVGVSPAIAPSGDGPREQAIRANDGRIRVVAATHPSLQPGHRTVVLLDGQAAQQGEGLSFDLTEVDRGRHELAVRIVDRRGQVLAESRSKIIHVLRASRRTAPK